MTYSNKTVQQHTAEFANGVIVTRESVSDLIHTCKVQIANTENTISSLKKQLDDEATVLSRLQDDLIELDLKNDK